MPNSGIPAGAPQPLAVCPHCHTQLRLLRPPAEFTPIKCYRCQAMFYIEPIETAPVDGPPPTPAPPMMPLPGSRLTTESNLPPLSMPPPPPPPVLPTIAPVSAPAVGAPASPSPPGLLLSPPPSSSVAKSPASSPPSAAPAPAPQPGANGSVPLAPVLQSPPVPDAGWRTAPARLPTPINTGRRGRTILDLGPRETTIAIAVTLAFLTALIVAGTYLVQHLRPAPDEDTVAATGAPDEAGKSDGQPTPPPPNTNASPKTTPLVGSLPPQVVEAATNALLGVWAARSDDETAPIMEFRTDGVAYVYDRMAATEGAEPSMGRWGVIGKEGDEITIAIYYAATGLDMHRMKIELVSPDCLNLLYTVFQGKVKKWDQRYVRESSPRKDARP